MESQCAARLVQRHQCAPRDISGCIKYRTGCMRVFKPQAHVVHVRAQLGACIVIATDALRACVRRCGQAYEQCVLA